MLHYLLTFIPIPSGVATVRVQPIWRNQPNIQFSVRFNKTMIMLAKLMVVYFVLHVYPAKKETIYLCDVSISFLLERIVNLTFSILFS